MSGLNDDFLLADDSMEPKDAPAVTIQAFKDTPEGDVPELAEDIDLIAVATEEFEIRMRDLELLRESISTHGGMSQTIALEAQVLLPNFINEERPLGFFTKHPSRTMLNAALEEVEAEKKTMLEKIWDFIIRLLKKVYDAVVSFFKNVDLSKEEDNASRAEKILKNKEKHGVDFANDVIKKLSDTNLSVLSAIEEDDSFIRLYNENIEKDRKIKVPTYGGKTTELSRDHAAADAISNNVDKLNGAITTAHAKDPEERDSALHKTLVAGLSIHGSENGAYLKAFAKSEQEKQRYEQIKEAAEKFKKSYAPEEVVIIVRAMAIALSKQFTLEVKVVGAYLKLNKAIIEVNDKIYEGV